MAFTMNFIFCNKSKIHITRNQDGRMRGKEKNELYLETKAPICTAEEIACVVLLYINKAEEII